MEKLLLAVLLSALITGCAKPMVKQKGTDGPPSGDAAKGDEDPLAQLNRLLPDFQEKIRASIPDVAAELTSVDPKFTQVIAYGHWLEQHPGADADSLTLHSDLYWTAFTTMSMDNPAVYFSRLFVLIGEGRLDRADYVKFFTDIHMDHRKESDVQVLTFIRDNAKDIHLACNKIVDAGVAEYDAKRMDKAEHFYRAALGIYPKSPRANYEMGLTLMTENLEKGNIDAPEPAEYYAKVRSYDPFYTFAYQGKKEISMKMAVVVNEIEPALKALGGKRPAAADFHRFAEGCVKLGEWELGAYAYHTELFMTLDKKKGFDGATADAFARCIRELGAKQAAIDIRADLKKYNTLLAERK
jgi:hypothetical protein